MDFWIGFLITAAVTAVSLLIISKIPIGVEIDGPYKALISGMILGILNTIAQFVPSWLTFLPKVLTLGLFSLIVNTLLFGLAAWLVTGFRLRHGLISAFLGAILVSFVNSILWYVLALVGVKFG